MKRNRLETITLFLGIIIIGAALFMMFIRNTTPQSIFITNLVFSVGFLIYILYSMMTTNSLNREIRTLNGQVKFLKEELAKKELIIKEKEARIKVLDGDKQSLQEQLAEARQQIADLEAKIQELSTPGEGTEA